MHQNLNYEDAMQRLSVKPCPHCAALERENRRLRIRLGLATGRVTRWEDNDGPMMTSAAAHLNMLRAARNGLKFNPIRLGDGTPEQDKK